MPEDPAPAGDAPGEAAERPATSSLPPTGPGPQGTAYLPPPGAGTGPGPHSTTHLPPPGSRTGTTATGPGPHGTAHLPPGAGTTSAGPSAWAGSAARAASDATPRGARGFAAAAARRGGKFTQGGVAAFRRAATADGADRSGLTALTYATMFTYAVDAAVAVALANTLFFAAATAESKTNVALYLAIT
ncbi:MAG: MFS transporter, partial [Pseudonocardia sp.]